MSGNNRKKPGKKIKKMIMKTGVLLLSAILLQLLNIYFEDQIWSMILQFGIASLLVGVALSLLIPGNEEDDRERDVPDSGTK